MMTKYERFDISEERVRRSHEKFTAAWHRQSSARDFGSEDAQKKAKAEFRDAGEVYASHMQEHAKIVMELFE